MAGYEYKVVPAPARGRKAPGVKTPEARFANGLETAMNALAAEGWEYLRADILPSEERQGLTSTQTVYRSVLVFRRPVGGPVPQGGAVTADGATAADCRAAEHRVAPAAPEGGEEPRLQPAADDTGAEPPEK